MMTSAVFGRGDIIAKWCGRFPTWSFSARATGAGVSALGFLLVSGIVNTETMDAFIEAGADPCLLTAETGTNILHSVAANLDANTTFVRYLLTLPGMRKLVNAPMRPQTFKWRLIYKLTRLLVRLGSKKSFLNAVSEWSMRTPLMSAAGNGNTAVLKVLAEEGGAGESQSYIILVSIQCREIFTMNYDIFALRPKTFTLNVHILFCRCHAPQHPRPHRAGSSTHARRCGLVRGDPKAAGRRVMWCYGLACTHMHRQEEQQQEE